MPKITYAATLPDGQIVTRKSDRTYTHLVARRHDLAQLLAFATSKEWAKTERGNWHYAVDQRDAGGTLHLGAFVEGEPAWKTAQRDAALARAEAFLKLYPTADHYHIAQQIKRIDAAHARVELGWFVEGWCGRPDLASKLAAKAGHCIAETKVIEVRAR